MKKQISLSFEIPEEATESQVLSMLLDSVAQYESATGPTVLDYVNRRFPLGSFARSFRENKIKEIIGQRALARKLYRAIIETGKVEVETSIATAVQEYVESKKWR